MIRQFTVIIEREGSGYVSLCPELDIASQGDTIEEARGNLQEAVELFFETASDTEIASRHGFREVRRRGSHIVMQKQLQNSTITVPVPDHSEIRIGTFLSIIRQSGVARTEFEQ